IVSGIGVLFSALAAFTVWPALLGFLHARGWSPGRRAIRMPAHGLATAVSARARLAVGAAVLLTIPAVLGLSRVQFNGNLLKLQPENLESVRVEREWLSGADFSSWFGVFVARDAAHAAQLRSAAAARTDLVARADTAGGFLPADPSEAQAARIAAIRAVVPPEAVSEATTEALHDTLDRFAGAVEEISEWVFEAGTEGAATLAGRLEGSATATRALAKRLRDGDTASAERLQAFWNALRARLASQLRRLRELSAAPAPTLESLPPELRERFIGPNGQHLVQVYPRKSLWDDANLREFCDYLSSIDPEATGVPFQVRHSAGLMLTGYRQAAWYALIAIAVLLLLDFRSITSTLLALIPVAAGATWALGAMGWFGIEWNLANLMAIPLLLGIGVDTGVHLVHRWRTGYLPDGLLASSTGHAVGLSAVTTMIGFGSLLLAQHGGLRSLGLVMVIGLAATLAAGLLVLPALLQLLKR
ncbi:MAG: MMPL family transporter, partial [Planctomycetota bacterium]